MHINIRILPVCLPTKQNTTTNQIKNKMLGPVEEAQFKIWEAQLKLVNSLKSPLLSKLKSYLSLSLSLVSQLPLENPLNIFSLYTKSWVFKHINSRWVPVMLQFSLWSLLLSTMPLFWLYNVVQMPIWRIMALSTPTRSRRNKMLILKISITTLKVRLFIWCQSFYIIWRLVTVFLLALYLRNSVCELLYLSVVLIFSFILFEARKVFSYAVRHLRVCDCWLIFVSVVHIQF